MTSEMGTEKTAEMSSKEKVLSVYPDAELRHYHDGAVGVFSAKHRILDGGGHMGWGQITASRGAYQADAEAWDDAANQLPSSPAEETASEPEFVETNSPSQMSADALDAGATSELIRNPKWLPEPVSPGNVIHVPRIPGTENTPVGPMIPAPEAAAEDEIGALINEVAPPPLVVSETAIRQLRPLLLELIARRKAEELIQELVDLLRAIAPNPYLHHHTRSRIDATLARVEEYRKGAKNG